MFNGFLKRQSSTIQDKSQETSEEADMNKKFQELVANYSHAWYCKSADMTTAETEAPINGKYIDSILATIVLIVNYWYLLLFLPLLHALT